MMLQAALIKTVSINRCLTLLDMCKSWPVAGSEISRTTVTLCVNIAMMHKHNTKLWWGCTHERGGKLCDAIGSVLVFAKKSSIELKCPTKHNLFIVQVYRLHSQCALEPLKADVRNILTQTSSLDQTRGMMTAYNLALPKRQSRQNHKSMGFNTNGIKA